jgi:hypothetical protein
VVSTLAFSCKSGKAGAASFVGAWARSIRDGQPAVSTIVDEPPSTASVPLPAKIRESSGGDALRGRRVPTRCEGSFDCGRASLFAKPSFAQDDRVASTPAFSCKSGKAGAASFAEAWARSIRDGPARCIDHRR